MFADGTVKRVRLFEGFEGTLQDIILAKSGQVEVGKSNQLNVVKLKNEHLAIMYLELHE